MQFNLIFPMFRRMITNGFQEAEILVLIGGAIIFLIGFIFLFISGKHLCGLFAIINALFYTFAFFFAANRYATEATAVLFLALGLIVNISTWIAVTPFTAKEVFKGFLIGCFALAGFSGATAAILSVFAEMLPFQGMELVQMMVLIISVLFGIVAFCFSGGFSEGGGSSGSGKDRIDELLSDMTGEESGGVDTTGATP